MKPKSSLAAVFLGAGLVTASLSAQATTAWTWTLDGTPSGGVAATATGYQATNPTSTLVTAPLNWFAGGYGVCESGGCTNPQHAMDNEGADESILLDFSSGPVNLTSFYLGWAKHDTSSSEVNSSGGGASGADVSVLAYTGSGTPITGASTYTNMLTNGWTLIGSYSNVSGAQGISTSVTSSHWLIAAYNSAFATSGCSACSDIWTSNDFGKLYSVAGTTGNGGGEVPEPGSLVLLSLPLLGLLVSRRRRA